MNIYLIFQLDLVFLSMPIRIYLLVGHSNNNSILLGVVFIHIQIVLIIEPLPS